MTPYLETLGRDLLLVLAGAAALLAALRGLGMLLDVIPMRRSRRDALTRSLPLLGAAVVAIYLMLAVRLLFRQTPQLLPFAVAALVVGITAAAWPAIVDLLSGIVIKSGRVCAVGDLVRIDETEGRVERMGFRVMAVQTSQGDEALIPYSRVARESVWRTALKHGATSHVFKAEQSARLTLAETRALVRQAALLSHWSSTVREPEISVLESGMLEITVFALDTDHAPEIERAVRRALTPGSTLHPRPPSASKAS